MISHSVLRMKSSMLPNIFKQSTVLNFRLRLSNTAVPKFQIAERGFRTMTPRSTKFPTPPSRTKAPKYIQSYQRPSTIAQDAVLSSTASPTVVRRRLDLSHA